MKNKNIKIYCNPREDTNIQIDGWKVRECASTVSVCHKNMSVDIKFHKTKIVVSLFHELENGDFNEIWSKEFKYKKGRSTIDIDESDILIKDLFGEIAEKATIKHCKAFISSKNKCKQ